MIDCQLCDGNGIRPVLTSRGQACAECLRDIETDRRIEAARRK